MRRWLTRNKIFFETVTAVLLSGMAILIGYLQLKTTQKQTSLIKIQTELAKGQINQQHKETALSRARDWAVLRELLIPIMERYAGLGTAENPAPKNLSRKKKIDWLSEMELLVSPLGTNPILVGSRHNYERYLAMLGDLRLAKELLLSRNPDAHSIFYQVTIRIGEHATSMWWDLGMVRSSRSPKDNIYKPATPEESIFEKGFPWENEIRRKDAAEPTASTDLDKPRR